MHGAHARAQRPQGLRVGRRCGGAAGVVERAVAAALGQRHHDLLEARVPCPLADPVDRRLDLPRPRHRARERVGRREAQVVLAVRRPDHRVRAGRVGPEVRDQRAELVRHAPPRRVRDVEGRRPGLDDLAQHPVQEPRLGPSGVLGRELDVVAAQGLEVLDGADGVLDDLVLAHPQLVLHVDLGGRDEGVHARTLRSFHGVPRDLEVSGPRAREAADDGDIPRLVDGAADVQGNSFHGLEVVRGGDGEACLDYVNAELGELVVDRVGGWWSFLFFFPEVEKGQRKTKNSPPALVVLLIARFSSFLRLSLSLSQSNSPVSRCPASPWMSAWPRGSALRPAGSCRRCGRSWGRRCGRGRTRGEGGLWRRPAAIVRTTTPRQR